MLPDNMTDSELETWRQTRAQGRGRFLGKIMLHRSLWLFVPFGITLLALELRQKPDGGFWSDCEFLAWAFAGVSLLIGLGDGLFLWRLRELDFQRKSRLQD